MSEQQGLTEGHKVRETEVPGNEVATKLQRTLPSSAYLSQEAFERERERIFATEWFCAGREEALSSPGDFLKVDVAGESVLIVRPRSAELRSFYNVCRHRGSRIVIDDPPTSGAAPGAAGRFGGSMVCPYHGWTYGLTGELRAAPFLTETDGLRREELSLHPVGVDTWGGFVFVHLSPEKAAAEGRTLSSQLGGIVERTARYPLAKLQTARRITYDVAANWKCMVENYNECYHCGPVHPGLCEVVPAFKQQGGASLDWDRGNRIGRVPRRSRSAGPPTGHRSPACRRTSGLVTRASSPTPT